ncbi:MAG TPA: hypothetical protein VGK73_28395 [Polyangiaceae bacterium]
MRFIHLAVALPLAVALAGCPKNKEREERFTLAEAELALDEASASTSAESLASANVELSTSFTLGAGLEQAAEELRTFFQSQLPCARVTLEGATLSVEYGVNAGSCSYRGHEFSGTSSITVERNSSDQVAVHHEWIGLSNGIVMLDGEADVTWDFAAEERRIVHHAEWTYLPTGRTGVGEGDRTQSPLAGGVAEGIRVEGSRSWTGERGRWDLGIENVEMRWDDPVPQSGSYRLVTPEDKSLSLSFERVDSDTIGVTVAGENRSFRFDVSKQ